MSRRPRSRPPAWASRACRRWRRPWPTRPPGAMMAIRADGAVAGSVSGGCIEDDL
ncbi:XdhC family protein, partial [Bordetella pertussis]|uniref:XdhC family protein n=1 Tax=Bordetella pertussis TaxID=520 RepID=UPI003879DC4C